MKTKSFNLRSSKKRSRSGALKNQTGRSSTVKDLRTKIVWTNCRPICRAESAKSRKTRLSWLSSAHAPSNWRRRSLPNCIRWTLSKSRSWMIECSRHWGYSMSKSMIAWECNFNSNRKWIHWLRRSANHQAISTHSCINFPHSKRASSRNVRRIWNVEI